MTGGAVTGHPELIKPVRKVRIDTGGAVSPDDACVLRRGLETLPLRLRRQCATAQVLAALRAGIRTVMLPKRNEKGLDDVPVEARAKLEFVLLERVEDAVRCAIPEFQKDVSADSGTRQRPALA